MHFEAHLLAIKQFVSHALLFVSRKQIEAKNSATVSRIIKDTLAAGRILDDSVGSRARKYLPGRG